MDAQTATITIPTIISAIDLLCEKNAKLINKQPPIKSTHIFLPLPVKILNRIIAKIALACVLIALIPLKTPA